MLTSRVSGIMSMPLLCSRDGRVLRNSRMSTITYQVTTIENVYIHVCSFMRVRCWLGDERRWQGEEACKRGGSRVLPLMWVEYYFRFYKYTKLQAPTICGPLSWVLPPAFLVLPTASRAAGMAESRLRRVLSTTLPSRSTGTTMCYMWRVEGEGSTHKCRIQ